MIRLGLTGSIGMGKSTIARMFRDEGVPVWDADEAVHRLYAASPVLKSRLTEAFGDVLTDNVVDRVKLSAALKTAENGFDRLNAIVHPLVVEDRAAFVAAQEKDGADMIVADIPLLYETGAESHLDYVLVVSAPADVQRQRVMARPGMTEEKFAAILSRQMPDAEKRKRAHFLIDTSQSLDACRAEVRSLVDRFT
ncbi:MULTISPECIES: dephospho-CoA kinase [Asticcacaulis]|uniref:dephospho-CoA kinase n=1 Tax=Asticcacaulis TaxID=76890 RepID=UPI001AE2E5FB|nr:dephospho-CoA kinase [Asticcacaulis sp. BE141]MBP2159892.1 dephospho-CoA kinase [Asticcacaulis solisilvae]MDR6800937.1 dephospho-CoA kinase [Asticcacaulis sp. BE141]